MWGGWLKAAAPVAIALALAACAGYRGGWESLPYIGDTPPTAIAQSRTPFEADTRATLNLPGLELRVAIDNSLQTYDTQVYLYVLPLSIDPREKHSRSSQPGKTRIRLRAVASDAGFVFNPSLAVLNVAGTPYSGVAGFEFGRWDANGNPDARAGIWGHQPRQDGFRLSQPAHPYLLAVDFNAPLPPPQSSEISLDLSRALASRSQPALPLIRFAPVRWKEGYT
jgi:hypothetical protein